MRFVVLFLLASALAAPAPAADPPKIDIQKGVEFSGRAEMTVVDIRPRVTGYLERVSVKEGDTVKKGDLLAEVDARVYLAELKLAKAKLAAAQAKAKLAATNLARAKQGFDKGVVSKDDFESAEGELGVAKVDVNIGEATVNLAELQLEYTKLRSPIDGRVGRFATTPGNLLKADETLIITVTSNSTVTAVFDMDERTMLAVRRTIQGNGGKPAVEIGLSDEDGFPHKAAFESTDCEIDPKTGSIRCRARLANPNGLIIGGSFLRVRLTVPPGK